jgi:hypothetical protein
MSKAVNMRQSLSGKLVLSLVLACLLWPAAVSGQREDPFKEGFSYLNNNRLGERLSVTFPHAEGDVILSTEMRLVEESYFDPVQGAFSKRLVAVITGMGMGNTGMKVVLEDARQREVLLQSLRRFKEVEARFRENESMIREKTEDWMGESWGALAGGRALGEVYFYPSRKELLAEFAWDLELGRVWMSIGSRIIVERDVVPFITHLVENLDRYRSQFFEYREEIASKNQAIDDLLGVEP